MKMFIVLLLFLHSVFHKIFFVDDKFSRYTLLKNLLELGSLCDIFISC